MALSSGEHALARRDRGRGGQSSRAPSLAYLRDAFGSARRPAPVMLISNGVETRAGVCFRMALDCHAEQISKAWQTLG